jgi:hypothetical protein
MSRCTRRRTGAERLTRLMPLPSILPRGSALARCTMRALSAPAIQRHSSLCADHSSGMGTPHEPGTPGICLSCGGASGPAWGGAAGKARACGRLCR